MHRMLRRVQCFWTKGRDIALMGRDVCAVLPHSAICHVLPARSPPGRGTDQGRRRAREETGHAQHGVHPPKRPPVHPAVTDCNDWCRQKSQVFYYTRDAPSSANMMVRTVPTRNPPETSNCVTSSGTILDLILGSQMVHFEGPGRC